MEIKDTHSEVYNFDKIYDRASSDSIKFYDLPTDRHGRDIIPLWVADMDFISPNPVIEVLKARIDHGIFGYPALDKDCILAVCQWFSVHHSLKLDPRWIIQTPGVIFAIANAIRALTTPGEAVMINRPVYHHFSSVINDLGRKLVNSPLVMTDTCCEIDFDDFEQKIIDNNVKLYILCNPHNPLGRAWSRTELERINAICLKHGTLVVSDEIHCDFAWPGHSHTSFGTLGKEALDNCIICTSPSKTFNLAGLCCANIIIANRTIFRKFAAKMNSLGLYVNIMGTAACRAAYSNGLNWLTDVRHYIYENIRYMESFLKENLPCIHMIRPESTYLVWTDMRSLIPLLRKRSRNAWQVTSTSSSISNKGSSSHARQLPGSESIDVEHDLVILRDFLKNDCGLLLDDGSQFGPEGAGFMRFNVACPRPMLEKALQRLKKAVDSC